MAFWDNQKTPEANVFYALGLLEDAIRTSTQSICSSLGDVRNALNTRQSPVMADQRLVDALVPLGEMGKQAMPFLKEIFENEFISAVTSRNAELEKNNLALRQEVDQLRERVALVLESEEVQEPQAIASSSPPF